MAASALLKFKHLTILRTLFKAQKTFDLEKFSNSFITEYFSLKVW